MSKRLPKPRPESMFFLRQDHLRLPMELARGIRTRRGKSCVSLGTQSAERAEWSSVPGRAGFLYRPKKFRDKCRPAGSNTAETSGPIAPPLYVAGGAWLGDRGARVRRKPRAGAWRSAVRVYVRGRGGWARSARGGGVRGRHPTDSPARVELPRIPFLARFV
ncbi:uncharacterized protein LOC123430637 [Hordeum vulgare subsp. vulgare]|uniref:Predicted protein n=1 Tax=Hordeum vulgare subsp. vulgare TaxID=112509 RepID=F2EJM9_HORVV|nr:uncharacterized protein LOC123430637 [Hordeum vulgare subsp. vulgare]BAK07551.1 predicted protein [Hordeum vulgare subsp. vulgare]